MSSEMQQI